MYAAWGTHSEIENLRSVSNTRCRPIFRLSLGCRLLVDISLQWRCSHRRVWTIETKDRASVVLPYGQVWHNHWLPNITDVTFMAGLPLANARIHRLCLAIYTSTRRWHIISMKCFQPRPRSKSWIQRTPRLIVNKLTNFEWGTVSDRLCWSISRTPFWFLCATDNGALLDSFS